MARAATTSDVFNAIAEPRRRQILDLLARGGEQGVGELVGAMRIAQPAVSKHLGVLRRVRIVSVSRHRLNAKELKPVHDWVKNYEQFWNNQINRIKARAEQKARQQHQPTEEK